MSYLDKYIPGKKGGVVHSVVSEAVEFAPLGASMFALGYAQNRWRDKFALGPVPGEVVAGIVGTGVALVGDLFLNLPDAAVSAARQVGHAGFAAALHTLGAYHGAKASGVKRLLVSDADVPKVKAVLPNAEIVGVEPAPMGDVLTARDLADLV